MSFWNRFFNTLRSGGLDADLKREMETHLAEAGRLVVMEEELPGGCCSPPSWLDQQDFRQQNHVFESMDAYSFGSNFLLTTGGETRRVIGGAVTPDYFSTCDPKFLWRFRLYPNR
ncbi:MAG TPA: hypothetical protein VF283_11335 [Bryobacteraceae bacterium]